MVVFDFIQQYDWAYLLFTLFIGLAVGSFLNVVILRLPKMMENQWRSDCAELNGEQATTPSEPYNLSHPASHCPKCRHKIRFWENIPVISWLLLRGRCSN
ncbi:MAG: prepilin peptidase, partial [Candidatus Thiodiazotropha endolucinida]